MQLVTEAIPSEGTVDGWRQVGSHAAVRHAGARSSRGRHAAVAVLLVAAGAAAVLMTLGSERGQQLAQLKTETDSTGLTAPQIPGIRAETQDIIDSGMWDPKAIVDDQIDGLLPPPKLAQGTLEPDAPDTATAPIVVDHPYDPNEPPSNPAEPQKPAEAAPSSAPASPVPGAPAPGAAGAQPAQPASGAASPPSALPGAAAVTASGVSPGSEGTPPPGAAATPPSETAGEEQQFEGEVDFEVQGHCTMAPTTSCTNDGECSESGGACVFWHCTLDPDIRCASSEDCASAGGICTGPGHCSGDPSLACFQDAQCTTSGGSCVLGGYCSGVPSRSCLSDSDCGDSGGSCRTKNKVWWEADENFPKDPALGPYPTWSRLQFHKKLLVLMLKILHLQSDLESQVPINTQFLGQISWLKEFLSSSSLSAGDAAEQTHVLAKTAVSTLDSKLSNDEKKLADDVIGLDSELHGIDERQDKNLEEMETDGPFREKMIGMPEQAYDRVERFWKDVNFSDVAWNRSDVREIGQVPALKGMVDRSIAETRGDVSDGIFRYKSYANTRYSTGYRHLYQLYQNFKYLTESHLSKAERDMKRINTTTTDRELSLAQLLDEIDADGHLETGVLANETNDFNPLLESWINEVEDAVMRTESSLQSAKLFKQAQAQLSQAKAAQEAAGTDPKALREAAEMYQSAANLYKASKAEKAEANAKAAVEAAESAATRLEAAAEAPSGTFRGEFWALQEDEALGKIPDLASLGEPAGVIDSEVIDYNSKAFEDLGWHDYFAARWTGDLVVNQSGSYTFLDNSDDGSKVYINNTLVVDNDGLHGPGDTVSGNMDLEQGRYPVTVTFFEKGGGADIQLKYSGPDTGGESVFLHAAPEPSPQPPLTIEDKVNNLVAAVSEIASFLKKVFPDGSAQTGPAPTDPTPTDPTPTGPAPDTAASPLISPQDSLPASWSFQKSDKQSTDETDIGNKKTHFLDRQTVDCGSSPINRFRLKTPGSSIKYSFNCAENGNLENPQEKVTDWEDDGDGNLVFLDRLKVQCDDDSFVTKFHYARNGKNDKARYEYSCAKSVAPLLCRNDETQQDDDGGGGAKIQFLDRHNVRCEDDEALQKFGLKRKGDDKIYYKYRCCKPEAAEAQPEVGDIETAVAWRQTPRSVSTKQVKTKSSLTVKGRGRSGIQKGHEGLQNTRVTKVVTDRKRLALMKRASDQAVKASMDLVTSKPLDQVAKDTDSAIASLRAAIISKKAKAKAGKKELHTSKGARKRQQSWKSIFDSLV